MEIEGQISILFDWETLKIEVRDKSSSTTFAIITLDKEQTMKALSRLGYTPCKIETRNLDRVGKTHENATLEFEVPDKHRWKSTRKDKQLEKLALKACPEGWIPDLYFSSQDSFFKKDGKTYARTTIRRWV